MASLRLETILESNPDRAADALARVVEGLDGRPLALALSGAALSLVADDEATAATLRDHGVSWVRTILSVPDLRTLPPAVVTAALEQEAEMAERAGLSSGVVLLSDSWSVYDLPTLVAADIRGALVPASTVDRAGVVAHLDQRLTVIPIAVEATPAVVGADHGGDDVLTLDEAFDAVRGPATRLDTPTRLDSDGRLRNKLIRLSTRLPDRPRGRVLTDVMDVAAAAVLDDDRATTILSAHEALVRARAAVDADRRRHDDWARISRLDWDADGDVEVHIELGEMSVVVDPHDGGALLVLDDKVRFEPIGLVVGEPPGRLFQFQTLPDGVPHSPPLQITKLEETKDEVSLTMVAGDDIEVSTLLRQRRLEMSYRLDGTGVGRFGPEFPLGLTAPSIRVDGGPWMQITETMAVAGHRLRFRDDSGREVLASAMMPVSAFLRPTAGGVVVWLHWATPGAGGYSLALDLDP